MAATLQELKKNLRTDKMELTLFEKTVDNTIYRLLRNIPATLSSECEGKPRVVMLPFALLIDLGENERHTSTDLITQDGKYYASVKESFSYFFRHSYLTAVGGGGSNFEDVLNLTLTTAQGYSPLDEAVLRNPDELKTLKERRVRKEVVFGSIDNVVSGGHIGVADMTIMFTRGGEKRGHSTTLIFVHSSIDIAEFPTRSAFSDPGFKIIWTDPNMVRKHKDSYVQLSCGEIPECRGVFDRIGKPMDVISEVFTKYTGLFVRENRPVCVAMPTIPLNHCPQVQSGICRLQSVVIWLTLLSISCKRIHVTVDGVVWKRLHDSITTTQEVFDRFRELCHFLNNGGPNVVDLLEALRIISYKKTQGRLNLSFVTGDHVPFVNNGVKRRRVMQSKRHSRGGKRRRGSSKRSRRR